MVWKEDSNRVGSCIVRVSMNVKDERAIELFHDTRAKKPVFCTDDSLMTGNNLWVASGQRPVRGSQSASLDAFADTNFLFPKYYSKYIMKSRRLYFQF